MPESSAPSLQTLFLELLITFLRIGDAVQFESVSMLLEQNSAWCLTRFAILRCQRPSSSKMVSCSVSMGQCQMVLSMCCITQSWLPQEVTHSSSCRQLVFVDSLVPAVLEKHVLMTCSSLQIEVCTAMAVSSGAEHRNMQKEAAVPVSSTAHPESCDHQ